MVDLPKSLKEMKDHLLDSEYLTDEEKGILKDTMNWTIIKFYRSKHAERWAEHMLKEINWEDDFDNETPIPVTPIS